MASQTAFSPTISLPASITSPPTLQFIPGSGCIDPEDHWVVVTSCFAIAINADTSLYTSPDWLTCQLTQFGPPENAPRSCYEPYTAHTVVDEETSFYSGCPSGYSGASTMSYSRSDGLESDFNVFCCPTQYNFNVDGYFTDGYREFTTESDGISYQVGYPLPGCATSYVSELSGSDIAVQTDYNTYGWEKRQVENVPWDYLYGTMYAEIQAYSYTVFHSTHTCYEDCYPWHSYYFSGGTLPPFPTDAAPATTIPVEEPTTTAATSSESEVGTPPAEETSTVEETGPSEETSSVEESSSIQETASEPSTTTSAETTSSPNEDLSTITSLIESTPTPTPSEGIGSITSSSPSSPSSTIPNVPIGAAAVATPTYLVLLGLFVSLIAL
ncbi:hypothetical protein F4820DRAFT_168240 [Hypoxylon rubiginosum]|uniref:Uncharacterized protein n=1 Tax=Hypoxylon rubiginosum TaxID=110542 RepID=A0ACB9YJ06_9PEZI|nr:hypothetical protein F4820DRAFT_168240 [Hypoxylon rubiginosum]